MVRAWGLAFAAACIFGGCTAALWTYAEVEDSLEHVPVWTNAYWGTSVPRVQPGSPVFYVERSWGAMKGMVYVAHRIDILIADPQSRKLILTVDRTRVMVEDLARATIATCKP